LIYNKIPKLDVVGSIPIARSNHSKPKCLQRSISLSMLRNGDKTLPGIYLACLDVRNNPEETGNKPRILTAMDLRQRVCENLVAESCTELAAVLQRICHQEDEVLPKARLGCGTDSDSTAHCADGVGDELGGLLA
jgi:hypothetical protein